MAELILKVGDTPTYKDGDILHVFTDKRISLVHAQNICNRDNIGFKPNGLRDTNSLTFKMFLEFYQYKRERISKYECKKTNLFDGTVTIITNPNLPQYFQQRLEYEKHVIFGEIGSEIEFGGNCDFSQLKIDNVWSQIAAYTGQLKTDYTLYPIGTRDPIDFLPLGLDADVTDIEADEFVKPLTDAVEGGDVV